MKKLENIPKTNIYKVPDGYFDKLPLAIQSQIEEKSSSRASLPYFQYAIRFALPVVLILIVAVIVLRPKSSASAEDLLTSVSTEQLITYLEGSNLTMDELLESYEFNDASIDAIEREAYSNYFKLDSLDFDLSDDFDLDNSNL